MIARELISESVSPLMTSDTGLEALSMMEEFKVRHLPIVNSEILLGVIAENDVLNMQDPESPIGANELSLSKPYVDENQHFYEVIKEISQQKLSLIPVVGKQMKYLGVVTLTDLIHELSHYNAVNQPGGIIVLQINEHDYSLSEMAKIVESNDAIILSSYLYSLPNSTSMEVTLKVNKMDISPILQTFERYGYQIKTSIFETHDEEMDERFEGLMRFLNI